MTRQLLVLGVSLLTATGLSSSPATAQSGATALQASLGYTQLVLDVNQPFASASTRLVPLSVQFAGTGEVASVQVSGLSVPVGPYTGGFQRTISDLDPRALLRPDEAAIMSRCRSALDYNQVDSVDTTHDTRLAVSVNGPSGATVASTNVGYQVGLRCKRIPPLTATIGFGKVDFDVNQSLAKAKASLVPLTVRYNGSGSVASVQVPGSVSYKVGPYSGSFQQSLRDVDIRALLRREEVAIVDRCRSVLDYNKATTIETSYDTSLPVTVNGPDGGVVASTSTPYQLGLTCRR